MTVTPVRALFDVFFARFFENETTVGRSDLRHSLLWLVGGLAAPGVFWGFWQSFRWSLIAMIDGEATMRLAVLFDKTLYLAYTAVAIGLVACVAWPALVIDRRDALILGVWPVRLRSIVIGKLAAILAYIGIIACGMHAGSAVMFGTLLGSGTPVGSARAIAGHFAAAVTISLFVFVGIAAMAAALLAILGPRRFHRISGAIQIGCVALVTTALVLLPAISGATVRTIRGDAAAGTDWILETPQLWHLGVYKTIAGTSRPVMAELAGTAMWTLGAAFALLLISYPIACRRVLSATSGRMVVASRPWSRSLGDAIVRTLARAPEVRGTLQFAIATIGRLQQPRLAIAIAMGIALTICVPILLSSFSPVAQREPDSLTVPLLAIGPTLLFFAAAGLRVALALPSELPARWLFASAPIPAGAGRTAAWRLMFFGAALPAALVTGIIAFRLWGDGFAVVAALAVMATGVVLAEVHLWGFIGVPGARLLAPGAAKLQSRWPLYLTGVYLTTVQLPVLLAAAHAGSASGWWLLALVPLAIAARLGSERAAAVNAVSDLDDDSLLLLDLSVPTPQKVTDARRA